MIDLLQKLPDSLVGVAAAATAWFGFNYTVLAGRAMERYAQSSVMPSCLATLDDYQAGLMVPPSNVGGALGIPELDILVNRLSADLKPRLLTNTERLARCECAVASNAGALRWDYALSTSSFRIYSPESISKFRRAASDTVLSGVCGSLPSMEG